MRAALANADRATVTGLAAVLAGVGLLAFSVTTQVAPPQVVAPGLIATAIVTLVGAAWVRWRGLLGTVVLVILLVPIRRYSLPGHLPLNFEPYRLCVALVALAWIGSLLVDARVSIRASGFEHWIVAILGTHVLSDVANLHSIGAQGIDSYVVKGLSFLVSFLIVFYFVVSLTRGERELDRLIKVLVAGMAFVGTSATIENRTRFNIFWHLHSLFPVLSFNGLSWGDLHDNRRRAVASAEHPIALGAGMAMVLPFAIYLACKTGQRRWWWATAAIFLGLLASRSRTGILMLVVLALVFLWLRPRLVKRFWPVLVPFLLAAQLMMPGLAGTLKNSFFPKGGLIAQQQSGAGTYGSGRLADLGPGIQEWKSHPLLGQGFATRITPRTDKHVNAPILDDEWLGTLLETGLVGFGCWIGFFFAVIRRVGRAAKRDRSSQGLLYVGVAAATAAYAESMATYDSFGFIQETFILFLVLAIGASALRNAAEEPAPPA